MRKRIAKLLFISIIALSSIGVTYAALRYQYNIVGMLPEPIQGLVTVASMGKHYQSVDEANSAAPVDVDAHEISFTASTSTVYNGINLVEYLVKDPEFLKLPSIFSKTYQVNVTMLEGTRQNVFVIVSETGVDNSYKVTLDANKKKITVEQLSKGAIIKSWSTGYNLKPLKTYQIKLHFGYESSGGAGGNRLTILESSTDNYATNPQWTTIVDKKLYQIDLGAPYSQKLMRFFAGSLRSNAKFRNEQLKVID